MSDLYSIWTANRIHSLRLRLGWSCSDLARRLECTSLEVLKWELQENSPEEKYFSKLEFIEKQAEEVSYEMQICPLAESRLESTDKEQILLDELI
ncbi:MAG: XRE family transcriptional regulator [Bdellovibrionales bacterium]|nr:XRE family transcriptional regulator [Bdellovibrionales bacterium]